MKTASLKLKKKKRIIEVPKLLFLEQAQIQEQRYHDANVKDREAWHAWGSRGRRVGHDLATEQQHRTLPDLPPNRGDWESDPGDTKTSHSFELMVWINGVNAVYPSEICDLCEVYTNRKEKPKEGKEKATLIPIWVSKWVKDISLRCPQISSILTISRTCSLL